MTTFAEALTGLVSAIRCAAAKTEPMGSDGCAL
jgi:hypothetical protein